MTALYKRILKRKKAMGLTWDELAAKAGIPVSTWMTGASYCKPTDDELKAMAPVLYTSYEWLKYATPPEVVEPTTDDTEETETTETETTEESTESESAAD